MKAPALSALVLVLTVTALQAQIYTVIDLGIAGTDDASSAAAINASGQVVGLSNSAANAFTTHAALFQTSGNVPLGFLDGTQSVARAINANGQIVGSGTVASGNGRAIRFSGTGIDNTNLGTLSGGSTSTADGINNSGQIVGVSQNSNGFLRATRFGATPVENADLGSLGGSGSAAYAINDLGTIVGAADLPSGEMRATVFGQIENTNLGTLGGSSSIALAINNSGVIVGEAEFTDFLPHAVRFSGTGTDNVDLGTLAGGRISRALGINSAGDIVGEAEVVVGSTTSFHGFIFRDGVMQDLNSLIPAGAGVVITRASGINDLGQIAANGRLTNGARRAVRLDPTGPIPPTSGTFLITAKAKPKSKGTVKGGGSYPAGTVVKLRAKPKQGREFLGWKDGRRTVSKKRVYRFTVANARVLSASFR